MSLAMAIALVVADAASNGVMLDAMHDEDSIWISSIEREWGRPGSGGVALLSLIEIADDHGVPLRAAVVRDHDRLLEYYANLGFDAVGHEMSLGGRTSTITIEYAP